MEDEIDLRKYILLLVKNWVIIIGLSLILAIGAFIVSKFVLTPTYEAKALVLIVPSRYSLTFDPKFQTESTSDLLYFRPTAQLAEADSTMQALFEAWIKNGGSAETTLEDIKAKTEVELDVASNSMQLIVTSDEPKDAAELVNLWASILVSQANDLFGEDLDNGETLEAQFVQTQADREAAQQALVTFEAQNQASILTTRLNTQQTVYGQLLADQAKLTQVLQDIETLQAQLSSQPASQPVTTEIEFTVLLLQLKAYNLDILLPQLQLSPESSETLRTAGVINSQLDQLHEVLEEKITYIALQLEPLQTEILQLQSQIKDLDSTREQLQQNYQVTSDTYVTLARKMKETKISNEVSGSIVKLAGEAIVPENPVGPKTLLNTMIAGTMGLVLGIFGVIARDFWVNIPEDQQHFQPTPAKP